MHPVTKRGQPGRAGAEGVRGGTHCRRVGQGQANGPPVRLRIGLGPSPGVHCSLRPQQPSCRTPCGPVTGPARGERRQERMGGMASAFPLMLISCFNWLTVAATALGPGPCGM